MSWRPLHPRVGGGYGQGGRACRNAQQPAAADQAQPGRRRRPGGDRHRRRQRRRCAPARAVRHHTGEQAGPSGLLHGAASGCVSASSACLGGARLRRSGSSLLPGLVLVATPQRQCCADCHADMRSLLHSGVEEARGLQFRSLTPSMRVYVAPGLSAELVACSRAPCLSRIRARWCNALACVCCGGCRDAGSPQFPWPNVLLSYPVCVVSPELLGHPKPASRASRALLCRAARARQQRALRHSQTVR